VVMEEARLMMVKYEEAETKRMEDLGKKMSELIEGVGTNLEEIEEEEEAGVSK
jgi:hypothetical protein